MARSRCGWWSPRPVSGRCGGPPGSGCADARLGDEPALQAILEENVGALDVQLSAEELDRIAADLGPAAGERYDESSMATIDR